MRTAGPAVTYVEHPDGSRTYQIRDLLGVTHEVHRAKGENLWPVPFRALRHAPQQKQAMTEGERTFWREYNRQLDLKDWARRWHAAVYAGGYQVHEEALP